LSPFGRFQLNSSEIHFSQAAENVRDIL